MAEILFVTWDGGGNVPPALGIAAELQSHGHGVRFLGHGGHATTMLALAHDLPLLVIPMHPLLDQPMVGRAVQNASAGRMLKKKAPARQLRPAIDELLADGPHRAAAARLGAAIRSADGTRAAADEILTQIRNGVTQG